MFACGQKRHYPFLILKEELFKFVILPQKALFLYRDENIC